MGHEKQRGRHGLLKCGRTGVIVEIRVHFIELLVLCVLSSTCGVNLICLWDLRHWAMM
jgi:hypothetical protein